VRALLLFLAKQEGFKNLAMNLSFFRKTALRFVAGETLDDAVRIVRQINQQKMTGTLDLLGENTHTRDHAINACREITGMFDRIRAENINCNVSVKLTQLGLALDQDFCRQNLFQIAGHAREMGNFVRVDMEDSPYTQSTLDTVEQAKDEFGNVGTVIQSYLYRSEQDTLRLLKKGITVRLVKGAYLEPVSVAFPKKKDTDANFIKLMQILLASDLCHAIATHDEAIIAATKEFARAHNIPKTHFEFQMLYGIRRDLQVRLAEEGYNVRIYLGYGKSWYSYFMRRLAERPSNVAFIARNFFKK
jgi:proline dehydrogenase